MQRLSAVLGSQGARERQGERRGPSAGERRLVAGPAAIVAAAGRRRTEVERNGGPERGEVYFKRGRMKTRRERERWGGLLVWKVVGNDRRECMCGEEEDEGNIGEGW